MVEHVLAALSGLAIDNCEVRVNAAEMPGCDGSAAAFVTALDAAGPVACDAPAKRLVVRKTLHLGNEDHWIELCPPRHDGLSIDFEVDYQTQSSIGRQTCRVDVSPEAFRTQLAPSRTFLLESEARWLIAQGFGARATPHDLLVFGESGPVDNQLRFDNECARHKALDVVGDLALAGCRIIGHVVAYRSGHQLNADLVNALLETHANEPSLCRCA
jgi:UDP-3-O-acyl-N-acetylglucosamine deacetylase